MKRILIAYDNSGCADAAIDELSLAGLPPELDATVITVAEVWLPPEAGPRDAEAHDRLPLAVRRAREAAWHAVETDCRARAERAATRLRAHFPKWNTEALAVGDSPVRGILKKAGEWRADLIVVGSHGRSAMERFFLGSVSQKIANEARCSVRIARPRHLSTHPHPRIIVAVDGSPDRNAAAVTLSSSRLTPGNCASTLSEYPWPSAGRSSAASSTHSHTMSPFAPRIRPASPRRGFTCEVFSTRPSAVHSCAAASRSISSAGASSIGDGGGASDPAAATRPAVP